jgi:hypothetical protein
MWRGSPRGDRATMQTESARRLAERLHAGDHEEDGTPLLEHVRRVARRVDVDAQHPRVRADGWSPPYARGLALLICHGAAAPRPGGQIASAHARWPVFRPDIPQGTGREVLFAQVDRRADAR